MSFLARRSASAEGAYFYRESKLAVSRLVEKNKKNNPNYASSLNSSISVVKNETQADVLPEILKHSLPLKISEPFSESSISTASKWNLPRDATKVHSLSNEAINPIRSYVTLPQAENKSKGLCTGMDKQVQENLLVKELSKNLGVQDSS
ncbi:hypothetical protein MKX01_011856 [Papaver californicum]|nr:hypothetical protein MKX01_011856 [Papaver californicum]